MKRIVVLTIVALMLTASGFISIVPMLSDVTELEQPEADLPQMEFPTIWQAPYVNTTLAAEGDLSSDSIPEFAETTDNDVLFYPDQFENDTVQTIVSTDDIDVGGDAYDYDPFSDVLLKDGLPWQSRVNDSNIGYLYINFTNPHGEAIDQLDYAVFNYGGSHNILLQIYDYDATAWDTIDDLEHGASNDWNNGSVTGSEYFDSIIMFRIYWDNPAEALVAIIDYMEVTRWYYMTFADSDHYAEGFTDVSDWQYGTPYADMTTDGDVATITSLGASGRNVFSSSFTPIPSAGAYIEMNVIQGTAPDFQVVIYDGSNWRVLWSGNGYKSNWGTTKTYIEDAQDWDGSAVEQVRISVYTATKTVLFDYLRIGPADEMGFCNDGSTTEGITYGSGGSEAGITYTVSSDGDILTLNATRTTDQVDYANFYIAFDNTTTSCDIDRDYYPFYAIDVVSVTTVSCEAYWRVYSDGYKDDAWTSFTTGVTRINHKAATTATSDKNFQIYATLSSTGDSVEIEIDYIKAYSIANFSYSSHANVGTDEYVYVDDSNRLHFVRDTTNWMGLYHDPALSVATAPYNVWNITTDDPDPRGAGSSFCFQPVVGGNSENHNDESRGSWDGTGSLTGFGIINYGANHWLSAIKFWEDATAPTISTFTNTPLDPSMASTVTIETISSDGQGVYTAEATAVVEPSGSNIGTVSMALDYTTQGGAEIWSYEFSAGDLSEGRYTFELDVSDAANSAYEYLTFTVAPDTQTTYIRIFDSLGDFVPFETFEVYRNGTRQYTDTFEGNTEYAYQIQVKDRWGESLNTTTFSAGDQELVVTVEVYSLKVMSWHYDFVRFNVTRAGLTYSEIVTPLEVINFRLYTNTYDWAIDYLNGTSTSGNINLTNSTALVVTGSTISDVYGLVNTVNTMTTAINITTTTISNEVVTVQLMFDWSNTTLYNQTINIIAAFNWENTTIYNQTVSIASLFNATNTVLYDQIILIQNMFNWENTTLYNQTISILNAFNATNTVLYSQTVSILADISNVNSTIYAQTVQMLLDLENSNSTLYDQTVTLLANIANVDSDIAAQTVTILADIDNVNSTIYAQTVQMLTDINNINSTIYAQTVMILSNLSDLNATVYLVDDPTHLNPLILGYSLSDDYCDFTIVSTWHNATLSFYDNDVLRAGPTSELLCPIRYPLLSTSGTHNLSVFVDGGNDSFWYNISYTVAEIVAFELEDWAVEPHLGVENYLECFFRSTWGNSTVYVHLNDSLQTSVLEQEGGISFSFWMSGTPGLHQYVFNVTSGANVITITWDFYLPDWAETALVVRWDLWTFQDNYTMLELESNWMNCTYYVYLNSSLVATSANDPAALNFTRAINIGTYNLTIYADGGAQTYTVSNIRYIISEEGVSYDFSTVSGGRSVREGDVYVYEGDDVVVNENPPGIYMTAETAATIAVSTVFIFFLAVLFMNSRVKKAQLDRDKKETQ